MFGFVCRIFGHGWVTTHTNRYQIPTRQGCCRCHAVREWRGGINGKWTTPTRRAADE
jgi:hypothetical protein